MTRQTVTSYDDVITFGKYKGKTIEFIVDKDPSYILWLVEENVVVIPDDIFEDAQWADADNSPPESYFWEPD